MTTALVLLALLPLVGAIPIDNGLGGEPEVQCGSSSITIAFTTQNNFQGVVYAKNHHNVNNCFVRGDGSSRGGGIEMNFDACNLNPKGIFVTATIVVQFHPSVLTKIDRAFRLECFYMEADKTVDQELEVSMITTELRTYLVPMPVCRYEIFEGNADGDPIRFVIIGQKIYHKWTCDSDTMDTFCMVVYGCYVDDGSGPNSPSNIELIDDQGCATDKNLLDNLDYPTDLMAGQQSHVFKYADRPQLYFNCQIRINVKEPNQACLRPSCPDPQSSFGRRKRESPSGLPPNPTGVIDVVSSPIFVADVELQLNDLAPAAVTAAESESACLGGGVAVGLLALLWVLGVASLTLATLLVARRLRA